MEDSLPGHGINAFYDAVAKAEERAQEFVRARAHFMAEDKGKGKEPGLDRAAPRSSPVPETAISNESGMKKRRPSDRGIFSYASDDDLEKDTSGENNVGLLPLAIKFSLTQL